MKTTMNGIAGRRALFVALLALATGVHPDPVRAQVDEAGITRAALDYLEGFYEGSDEKLRRSISPDVVKTGYFRGGPDGAYAESPMTYAQMFAFADGVRNGRNLPPAGAPKEVEILHAADQIAVARVTAWWGFDYLQMARIDGRWMIRHVLWQSPPANGS